MTTNPSPTTHVVPRRIARPVLLNRPGPRSGTLLLVEDSRHTSDAIRQMFQGAGGRLRRADSLEAGRRHLALYAPDAVIVDLGLPDGSGLELIAELHAQRPRVPLIIAISGQIDLQQEALAAGADRFLAKPFRSVTEFRTMLAPIFFPLLHNQLRKTDIKLNSSALRDDLYLALELLARPGDPEARGFALRFVGELARSLGDIALLDALEDARAGGCLVAVSLLLRQRLKDQPLI